MKKIHLYRKESELASIPFLVSIIQIVIGFIFLIPPFLGAIFFSLAVYDIGGYTSSLEYLSVNWTGSGNSMSAAPVYLGLMAIAGGFMVHSAVKNIMTANKFVDGFDVISDIIIDEIKKEKEN